VALPSPYIVASLRVHLKVDYIVYVDLPDMGSFLLYIAIGLRLHVVSFVGFLLFRPLHRTRDVILSTRYGIPMSSSQTLVE
jgi:hypothetical protein